MSSPNNSSKILSLPSSPSWELSSSCVMGRSSSEQQDTKEDHDALEYAGSISTHQLSSPRSSATLFVASTTPRTTGTNIHYNNYYCPPPQLPLWDVDEAYDCIQKLRAELNAEHAMRTALEEEVQWLKLQLLEARRGTKPLPPPPAPSTTFSSSGHNWGVIPPTAEENVSFDKTDKVEVADAASEINGGTSQQTPPPLLLPLTRSVPFHHIPIIDLSKPFADVVANISMACGNVGFMYIMGHGMDMTLSDQIFDLAKSFFQLPTYMKEEVSVTKSKNGTRGYFALGSEDLNGKGGTTDIVTQEEEEEEVMIHDRTNKKETKKKKDKKRGGGYGHGDYKEGYDCGREISPTDPDWSSCPTMMDYNQWPKGDILPEFRTVLLSYQNALLQVANKLLVAFAIGLGLSPNYFTSKMTRPMCTLRLLHYPPQPPLSLTTITHDDGDANNDTDNTLDDVIGCGAHTDYGCCTILNQDSVGGLQVRNSQGQWIDAPYIPETFVINIGDMMNRWTNGRYASTVHRVVNTSGRERYSIPFFLNPNVGTMVECLETCQNEKEPPRYSVERSEVILRNRYEEAFAHMDAAK